LFFTATTRGGFERLRGPWVFAHSATKVDVIAQGLPTGGRGFFPTTGFNLETALKLREALRVMRLFWLLSHRACMLDTSIVKALVFVRELAPCGVSGLLGLGWCDG